MGDGGFTVNPLYNVAVPSGVVRIMFLVPIVAVDVMTISAVICCPPDVIGSEII
jgi:hypothetical protein